MASDLVSGNMGHGPPSAVFLGVYIQKMIENDHVL